MNLKKMRLDLVFSVGTLFLLFFSLQQSSAADSKQTFTDLRTGSALELNLHEGLKHRVFVFVSSACPCSTSHGPFLNRLSAKFASKGFEFFGLHPNVSEDKAEAVEYYSQNFEFPILDDTDQKITRHFKAIKTPQAFIVSPEGETIYLGALSDSRNFSRSTEFYLESALSQIVSGAHPDPKMRKALGCAIERI